MKWINYAVWLLFTITLPLMIEATVWHAASYAATETASVSGIKALYGSGGSGGDVGDASGRVDESAFALPTQSSPPGGLPGAIKPTAAAIRCPDGVTRSAVEILALVRAANPELPIWDEPELTQALSGERGVWQWIKDHVKITINAFGLHFQVYNDDFCGQLTVMWWNGWNATWEPC